MRDNVITILWNRRNHHDNLVHTRLHWLLLAQSFLLSIFFAVLLNVYSDKVDLDKWILLSIPVIGWSSIIVVYVSIIRGINAYGQIREQLHEAIGLLQPEELNQDDVLGYSWTIIPRNEPRSWNGIRYKGFFAVWSLPILFSICWIALGAYIMKLPYCLYYFMYILCALDGLSLWIAYEIGTKHPSKPNLQKEGTHSQ